MKFISSDWAHGTAILEMPSSKSMASWCWSGIALDTSTQTMQQQCGTTNNALEVSCTRGTLSGTEYGASQRNDSQLHTKDIIFSSKKCCEGLSSLVDEKLRSVQLGLSKNFKGPF